MADASTYIGVNAGAQGSFNISDYSIATSAPANDFYFFMASVDANSNVVTREKAILALKGILGVLESNGTFTTNMEG